VWAISEELGVEKPDPRIYAYAVERAGAGPARSAMVGDRLDYDVVPAKQAGMHTVWVLRGEAPSHPTANQLSIPDAWVRSVRELPATLERIGAPAIEGNA
jgi:FMN phosphatase YigB (HAD superfamily)